MLDNPLSDFRVSYRFIAVPFDVKRRDYTQLRTGGQGGPDKV